ncbi:A/G-specific adenine glycosylase [Sneathiella aquimaris]|uniref:A/G-specific adenine glycosylase n=1 Tax=Sneathiella aquimaris TaxID=2599305 RepID=UPI0014699EE7|nr:A/G-specific adenine glycosylase [Sneathiella aquimaris]
MDNQLFATKVFSQKILKWYDVRARILPWRSPPGKTADAYHVWLSEIMLQQTTVATVGPYFEKFLNCWPTVQHLANASLDDVLVAWAGLGYYARARNLHKCAGEVCQKYGGHFPQSEKELLTLPGIGEYTAAAIASIAYGVPAVVVDGNIERIITRVYRVQEALPKSRSQIRELAARVSPESRPGDYAQALMDIGATICTPKKPRCSDCPVNVECAAYVTGDQEQFPKKAPKKTKPTRKAAVLWIENHHGEVLLRRREEKGLLGGMMEFPSTSWVEADYSEDDINALLSELGDLDHQDVHKLGDRITHTFTHFHLHFTPHILRLNEEDRVISNHLYWVSPEKFAEIALPTLMTKVVSSVKAGQGILGL